MKKSVIVVDNDETLANIVAEILKEAGYKAVVVDTYKKLALEIKRDTPDLILSDYRLDKTTGSEICKRIKTTRKTAKIPVVVYSSEDVEKEVTKNGASDFFKKPFEFDTLLKKVQNNINQPLAPKLY